ncbi:hypothetical protein GCM10010392_59010 [Streptomyces clavifer]|nr:hypothetical protein GCM10010392_59010 [Streptomyces clavifer]
MTKLHGGGIRVDVRACASITPSRRRRILTQRPDILLTTPESLESMLVSTHVDHRAFFSGLHSIVVDEVHAFAGDDRGWHLLAVLERLTRVTGRPLQRIGLSATVGNPDDLLTWLQGSGHGTRPGSAMGPPAFGSGMTSPLVAVDDPRGGVTGPGGIDGPLMRGLSTGFTRAGRALRNVGVAARCRGKAGRKRDGGACT